MRKLCCAAATAAGLWTSAAAAQPVPPPIPPVTVDSVTVTAARPAPPPSGPRLELYEERDLAGAGVILVRESPNLLHRGFSDRARSARAFGSWQVCAGPNFEGPCATLDGDTPFLGSVDLSERISSARPLVSR